MSRFSLATVGTGAALVALALAGCSDPSAPDGTSGALTVRAYIDRDASNSFTTADSALAGVVVALARDGAEVSRQTTGATGAVSFADLAPGSYQLSTSGATPAGAVLTSNPSPTVAVAFQGGQRAVDFTYAYFPGVVSGVVYRDENANGAFESTDTPGPGITVYLRRDSAGPATGIVDSTVTGNDGAYRFARVAPGTYFVAFRNPGTISFGAAGDTRRVTVSPQGTFTLSPSFTGSLIIGILEARTKAVGATVAVVGNVTVRPGTFPVGTTANSEIWIQDATGGIAVVNVPTADSATYALGDQVEVTGPISLFSGQRQIAATRVRRLAAGTVVAPLSLTAAQARALGTNEGRLVRVNGVTVATIPTGTGAAFTVIGTDAGGDTVQIRVNGLPTGLTRASFTVGSRYNLTGVLTQFNGVAQIKPRTAADLAAAAPLSTIAAARAAAAGTVVTIAGNVSVAPGAIVSGTNFVNSEIWVQDATGGIAVFSAPTSDSTRLFVGDRVEVTGTTGGFGGQLQLGSPTIVRIGSGTLPAPKVLTGMQVNSRADDGILVRLPAFTVTSIGTGTGTAFNVIGTAADGQLVTVRVGGALTGITRATFSVGTTYAITGILSQNNGVAQIKVRTRSDVTP
jgi:DNA/RNA endonuclease YhcR with UshA esterase domain